MLDTSASLVVLTGSRMRAASLSSLPTPVTIGAIVALIVLLLLLAVIGHVLRTMRRVHELTRAGREASAAAAAEQGNNPVTSFNRDGLASDPINVKVVASNGQLAAAFAAAGWYRADEIDFITSFRISYDSIFGRKYATAPVSNLYLYGRKEDYAFERPGSSVRERDHVRFWNTGSRSGDGRNVWVGGATRDIKVEISPVTHLPTHKISSNVDAERDTVLEGLVRSGWVIGEGWEASFGEQTEQRNSLGDMYYTDGRRIVLTLANVPVFSPLATQVRGRALASAAQTFARAVRWTLPKEGRDRAAKRARALDSTSTTGGR